MIDNFEGTNNPKLQNSNASSQQLEATQFSITQSNNDNHSTSVNINNNSSINMIYYPEKSIIKTNENNDSDIIFKQIFTNNGINNSMILSDNKEECFNKVVYKILQHFEIPENKRYIIYIINEKTKINSKVEDLNNALKNIKVGAVQTFFKSKGNQSEKETNTQFFNNFQMLVTFPELLYKFLSVGFITFFETALILIDDYEICFGNSPLNNIIDEFYYFYLFCSDNDSEKLNKIKQSLPKIIGHCFFPFKKRQVEKEMIAASFQKLCDIVDGQIIISPKTLKQNEIDESKINPSESINFFQTTVKIKNNSENSTNLEIITKLIEKFFIVQFVDLVLASKNFLENNVKNYEYFAKLKESIIKITLDKFSQNSVKEYLDIAKTDKVIYSLTQTNLLFKIFDKIVNEIFLILLNLNLNCLLNYFKEYRIIFDNLKDKNDLLDKKEIKQEEILKIIDIFLSVFHALDHAKKKGLVYKTDRIKKLKNELENITAFKKNNKILIIVSNRLISPLLNDYLSKKGYKSTYAFGQKASENAIFFYKKNYTYGQKKEAIDSFNEGKNDIIICGTELIDEINVDILTHVIVFNELNDEKKFSFIKQKFMHCKIELKVFTNDVTLVKSINKEIDDYYFAISNMLNKDQICYNFQSKNYIKLLQNEFKEKIYFIKTTHAKITYKNATILMNDIITILNAKKLTIKHDKIFSANNENDEKKYQCTLNITGSINKTFESKCEKDKLTTERECIFKFVTYLHKNRIIDDNLRIKK